MNIAFKFRNVESSEAIKAYAEEKIGKLQKYLHAPMDVDVIISLERRNHCVDVHVRAGGNQFAGTGESEDMYASIDMVIDKIDRQVRDGKAAAVTGKRHRGAVAKQRGAS